MYCNKCGRQFEGNFCPNCGAGAQNTYSTQPQTQANFNEQHSDRDWLVTLILSIVLGHLGAHRFYCGKIGTGIVWLLTGGCFLIGYIVDLVTIAQGDFRDIDGKVVRREARFR